ncbi:ImmA/IrrE family metallo-endopeptidase [Cellulosimicrobium funkei]|uniref:ImmA/IrrE family metallo-endopeptidase n=1 Tax=Cellulosimicrobium funkei TaxID=264251 RepID=UPI00366145BB
MYHPWRALRALQHVTLVWTPMLRRLGATNGRDTIHLDPRQYQVERRCTLAHELVHLELGHDGGCSPVVERQVRREAARRLIALDRLVDAWRWAMSLEEVADECWVTPDVLRDRLDYLEPDEAQRLADAILAREDGA